MRDAAVVVEAGEVVYAGPRTGAPGALHIAEIDGFLMPAGADRHVHIGLSDPVAVLHGGITAVRDMAWPPGDIFAMAHASELPSFNGPLIRAAGPMLTAPGGYPTQDDWAPPGTGRELRGPEDAAAAVVELTSLGAAVIKVSLNSAAGPTPTDAELTSICQTAGERGLPVATHAEGKGQVERALGAGIEELAHTPWTERLPDGLVEGLARRMRIVTTLDMLSYGEDTPEIRTALDNLRRFRAAGGTVIYGTDLGNGPIPPGIHVRELQLMREAGLDTETILTALIRSPLEPGAPADLIALGGDPFEDLAAFGDLRLVIRAGRVVVRR